MNDLVHRILFTTEYPFHYISAAALLVIMVIVGILFTYIPLFQGRTGKLLFHMRLGQLLLPYTSSSGSSSNSNNFNNNNNNNSINYHNNNGNSNQRYYLHKGQARSTLYSIPMVREMLELSRVSVGELLVLLCLVGEAGVWFWYGWVVGMEKELSALRCGVIALGKVTQWILMLMFVPVARNSLLCMLFGVSFERSIKFHRWLSILFWLTGTIHGALWVTEMYVTGTLRWSGRTKSGLPTWIVMSLVILVAMEPVRRRFYELFKYIHILGTVAAMVLFLWHEKWTRSIPYVAIAMGPLLVDQLLRLITPVGGLLWPAAIVDMRYDARNEIIKLVIERPMWLWQSIAGAYVMLWVPRANLFLGHPVTIIPEIQEDYSCDGTLLEEGKLAADDEDDLPLQIQGDVQQEKSQKTRFLSNRFTVFLKKRGGFTTRLASLAQKAERGELNPRDLTVRLEGPYASTPIHFDALVLVAGGIGITPMLGILSHCVQRSDLPVKKIVLLWVVRNKSVVDMFTPTITRLLRQRQWCEKIRLQPHPDSQTPLLTSASSPTSSSSPSPFVEIQFYVTSTAENADCSSRFTCNAGMCQTALASWTFGRRPDIGQWIANLEKNHIEIRQARSVGVSCCGARSMMDDVERACALRSKFCVYPETFDW